MLETAHRVRLFDSGDREFAVEVFEGVRAVSADGVGVTRPSYSEIESAALGVIVQAAQQAGLMPRTDAAANVVVEASGGEAGNPTYWLGSHIDSVPEGGNFDGLAGIVAGLLCLRKMRAHATRIPLTLICLRGEESAWFGKPYLGSSAIFGKLSASDLERKQRRTGLPLAHHMERAGVDVQRILSGKPLVDVQSVKAYFELHIEQGPIMVARQAPVGIVTGIRGSLRHVNARCVGQAGHSGAVPRWLRHDAVFALADLLMRLDEHWQALNSRGVDLVITTGMVGTKPNEHSVSRIPGEVLFSLEFRSESVETLESFYQIALVECRGIEEKRRVKFELGERVLTKPGAIDIRWAAELRRACHYLGICAVDIPSGAGHDAAIFADQGIPAAMLFIRNENGSHNPAEQMEVDDFMLGVEVLYRALLDAAVGHE